jgi:hypothetical protein
MILIKDRVAADFLVRSMESHSIGLGYSWDILVGTVWLHLFLCLHEYIYYLESKDSAKHCADSKI